VFTDLYVAFPESAVVWGGVFNDWLAHEFVDSAAGAVLHGNFEARRIVSFRPD
jgi:hypothetical protein